VHSYNSKLKPEFIKARIASLASVTAKSLPKQLWMPKPNAK
jgi:hypothetical protein